MRVNTVRTNEGSDPRAGVKCISRNCLGKTRAEVSGQLDHKVTLRRTTYVYGALVWGLVTSAIATYAVLKPATTAADLRLIPPNWVLWLDANYDLRTLVMSLGVLLPPACLFAGAVSPARRRRGLAIATLWLAGLEFAQLWIPTRGFAWSDVAYTLAGGVLAELAAMCCQRLKTQSACKPQNAN